MPKNMIIIRTNLPRKPRKDNSTTENKKTEIKKLRYTESMFII